MPIPGNKEYRENPAISQSELKTIFDPFLFFSERKKTRTVKRHFEVGSAVDYAIAYGLLALRDEIVVIEERPTSKIHTLAEYMIENGLDETEENILYAREECKYNRRLRDSTVIEQYETSASWYYNILLEAEEKIILTEEDLHLVIAVYESLRSNRYTSQHIGPREGIVRLNHPHIYFKFKGVECKAELDQIEVDLDNMLVRPLDFKTMADYTREFPRIAKQRRYDIQAAWYFYALDALISGEATSDIRMDLTQFRMLPFRFVVETTNPQRVGICPLSFEPDHNMMYVGRHGIFPERRHLPTGPVSANYYSQEYKKILGFEGLIDEYLFQLRQRPEDRVYTSREYEQLVEVGSIALNPW